MGRAPLAAVFLVPAIACAAWTVFAGKDVNWDLLNYHYYAPFALLSGRLQQDFFAASAQSYLNPLGYVPFYLLASSWHSVIASIVLALAHSLSIALLYLIAWRMFAHLAPRDRALFAGLAAASGAATSVYWATVGTSFLDPLLVPPMLAGLLLLLDRSPWPLRRAALAGALFGVAAALKYSNAIFVVAALPLALALPGLRGAGRLRAGIAYSVGCAFAAGVLAGPWLALMYWQFGNPVFPLLNAWFQSPHAPAVNAVSMRFTPPDFATALAFPFRMLLLDRSLYSETFAPDLRFAALVVGAVALPMLRAQRADAAAAALRESDWRVFVFLAAGTALWLATSANGRYGMVVLLLSGVCLIRIIERAINRRAARIAILVILAVQVAMTAIASPSRWFVAAPWSSNWLPYEAPERARHDAALYLTVETLPMAVVAPSVHPASSFANLRGLHSIATDAPRLTALLEHYRDRVRVLGRGLHLVDGKPRADVVHAYDRTLLRVGYRVDPDECFTIEWQADSSDALSLAANRFARISQPAEMLSVVSCRLVPAVRDPSDLERERHVSILFDRMEKACPRLFRGQTAVTEPLGSGWSRHYAGLDARLEAGEGGVVLNRYRAMVLVHLGRLSDWERANPMGVKECGRLP